MTATFIYLMIGLFIAWLIALILVAGGATYIENLVKKMKQEKRDKDLKKITNVESIDIFDQIKDSSPWSSKD